MAKKTYTTILDDLDGSEGAETVTFSYEGRSFEVDLSEKNRDKLSKALEPFINAGRSTSSRRASTASRGPKKDLDAIRSWARDNGHEVSDRGRIAASVVEAYEAANK